MLEIVEQIEPHILRKNYSINNIRSSKTNKSTHSHWKPSRSNNKRVENKYVQVFMEL